MSVTAPYIQCCTHSVAADVALTVGPAADTLRLTGDLDVASAGRLTAVLHRLEANGRPLLVDVAGVRFADTHGIAPVLDAAARRAARGAPALQLTGVDRPVARILGLLGVTWSPGLDLTGWRAAEPPSRRVSGRSAGTPPRRPVG